MNLPMERRTAPRFAMSLPVTVRLPHSAFEQHPAMTRDVSSSGIFFYMTARPEEGSPIEFTVTLPPEVTLTDPLRATCKGRVVRVEPEAPDNIGVGATIEGYQSFIRLTKMN